MKEHESSLARRTVVGVFVALCVLTACTGADDGVAVPTVGVAPTEIEAALTPVDEVEPTVVVADPTVTPAPVVVVSDEDRIAAVYEAFDADPDPSELIAWDLSDPFVNDAGLVSFRVCGWDGQGVFDQIYDAVYETYTDDAGAITTRRRDVALSAGDCLNTTLLTSVFDFIAEVNGLMADSHEQPAGFAQDDRAAMLLSDEYLSRLQRGFAAAADEGVVDLGTSYRNSDLLMTSVHEVMYRRFESEQVDQFHVLGCEVMDPAYGEYRDGVLLDDNKVDGADGPHSIIVYELGWVADSWEILEIDGLVWSECGSDEDWVDAVNSFRPDPLSWDVLVQ